MKIEFDPSLSKEEKRPHMVTWWSTAHENMVKAKLNNNDLDDAVKNSEIILRNGEADFFQFIKEKSLPVLLFSAGITQIVQAAMKYKSTSGLTSNMDVVSNNMIFDESDGNLVSFSEPLIHTFSKTTASIGEEWKKTLNSRPNVVLMGDSHGDPDMVRDEDTPGSCLRLNHPIRASILSFFQNRLLNHHPEKNREIYENLYDIVLVSDESLSVPIEIFKILCNV